MGSLLSQLYNLSLSGETPLLRPFVSTAMSSLLGSCPGLAARLFGDVVPIGPGTPQVHLAVPASSDLRLDIVIEGEDGVRLLIENQIAPAAEWFEERSEARPSNHVDNYIAAARHRYGGRARVLALARTDAGARKRNDPAEVFAGTRTWPAVYTTIQNAVPEAADVPAFLMRAFLHLLKEHDMNPADPLVPNDADTILAFDAFARNNLKLLDEAVGRIRQEFDLKVVPNNRRLTGWYAASDRYQSEALHLFFYLMFPPVADLVVRAGVQVTKESSPKGFAATAEHGFRKGRWGSQWVERDFRRQHPFLALSAERQVEDLVRFFHATLARLEKVGLVKKAPARHEPRDAREASAPPRTGEAHEHGTPRETGRPHEAGAAHEAGTPYEASPSGETGVAKQMTDRGASRDHDEDAPAPASPEEGHGGDPTQ